MIGEVLILILAGWFGLVQCFVLQAQVNYVVSFYCGSKWENCIKSSTFLDVCVDNAASFSPPFMSPVSLLFVKEVVIMIDELLLSFLSREGSLWLSLVHSSRKVHTHWFSLLSVVIVTSLSSSSSVMAFPCLLISLVPSLSSPTATGGGGAGGSCDVLMPRDFLPGSVCSLPPPSLLLCSLLPQDLLLVGCAESGLLRGLFWWGGGSVSRHGCISAWWVDSVSARFYLSVGMENEQSVCACVKKGLMNWLHLLPGCQLAAAALPSSLCSCCGGLSCFVQQNLKADRCLSDTGDLTSPSFSELVCLPVFFLSDFFQVIFQKFPLL